MVETGLKQGKILKFKNLAEFLEHAEIEASTEAELAKSIVGRHQWTNYNPDTWYDWQPKCPLFKQYLTGSSIMYDMSFNRGRGLGFSLLSIYGLQGGGKTVLAMYTAYEIMCKRGRDVKFKNIIDNYLVFSPIEFYNVINKQFMEGKDSRKPVLIWDDAGVYASARLMWLGGDYRKTYLWIVSQFQLVRSHIANLIFTTPDIRNLPRDIRSQNGAFVARVEPVPGSSWSVVVYYQFRVSATGKLIVKRIGVDRYYVVLPDEIYKYYMSKRKRYEREMHEYFSRLFETKTNLFQPQQSQSPNAQSQSMPASDGEKIEIDAYEEPENGAVNTDELTYQDV